jgi:RimJ/RimL family protein N-acetyltransferase
VEIAFRPLLADDLPLLHEWLQREHVRRWWGDEYNELDSVVAHYRPAIDGTDPTDLYLILLDATPRGYIETYLVVDHPPYEEHVQVGPRVAGVDLFLADAELLGRGLGPRVLEAFVDEVVLARDDVDAVIATPQCENVASIRAFEKAGFRRVRIVSDPEEPGPHQLMRRDRS